MNDDSKPPDPSAERHFLHDLASPLATAIFVVDIAIEEAAASPEAADSLRKAAAALEKMKILLHARRTLLIQESEGGKP